MRCVGDGRRLARSALIAAAAVAFAGFGQLGALPPAAWAKDGQPYLDRAKTYIGRGNFNAAEIELRNAERAAPKDAHIRALLAQVYLRLGNFQNAERAARAARDLGAPEAEYILTLAEAMMRLGKLADIPVEIKPADRAPELESRIRVVLGTAAAALRDPAKAETLLRQAMSLDPNAAAPKLSLAKVLLRSKPEEAEKLVDDVLAAEPKSSEAIAMKGEMLARRGDVDGAMQRFTEALTLDPGNIGARLARANIHLNRGEYAAFDGDLEVVSKAAPQDFRANYLRALAHVRKREFAEADRILDRLSPNFADLPQGFYVQALTKHQLKQSGQAAEAIAKYIARVPNDPAGARLAASIALGRGNRNAAVDHLTTYLRRSPPDATTLALLGKVYTDMGKSALALEQFQKAAELAPNDAPLKAMVAAAKIDAGERREGIEELEGLFATEGGEAAAGPPLVISELRAGRIDRAAEVAEKLVAEKPDLDAYQVLLGMVRAAQKDYPAAEKIFAAIGKRNPDSAPARNNLAQIYLAAGRVDDARKTYQDFLSRKPDSQPALLALADIAAREEKWDEAIGHAEKARSAAPRDPAPGVKLLNLHIARQDWTRARVVAGELGMQFPGNAAIAEAQGRMLAASGDSLAASGDSNAAIDSYRQAYEAVPNSEPILQRYLRALIAAKRFQDARTVLQARLDKDPGNRTLKQYLIRLEAETDGIEAGLAKARAFAKGDSGSSVYDLTAADLYARSGKRTEAVTLLEKSAAAHPGDTAVAVTLARLYTAGGDPGKAEALLVARAKERPDDLAIRRTLADIYLLEKKYDAAASEETRILSQRPNDPISLNNLAWIHQQRGDLAKARELAEKAVAAAPATAPATGLIRDTLGWVMLAQGDIQGALYHLEAASAALPGNPEIQYHLSVALQRAGRASDARAVLEKLLSSGVSFTSKVEAEKLLAELKRG
jgi:cellulose synthase operon protein C